eukprot:408784_1
MVQHTQRRTADKLIQLKLHDLCMIETAYCIHHFFGPQSVFDLLHDESTDGISFLLAALSFKPDYNDEDIYVPKLLSGNIVKVICSQELSDKTANSAVYQALLPTVKYLNWIGYKLYGNAWTDLIPLMQKHMNAVTDENTTAIATSHMFFKAIEVVNYAIWICLYHQLSNSIKPAIKYSTSMRTAIWNTDSTDCVIDRSSNISIIELANKSALYFKTNSQNEKARPDIVNTKLDEKESENTFKTHKRVVGERLINCFTNCDRLLERRQAFKETSTLCKSDGKSVIPDNKLFYEYGHNGAWLRENIVAIAFNRSTANPLLRVLNTSFDKMKKGLEYVKQFNSNLQKLISKRKPYSNEWLGILLGCDSISPVEKYCQTSKYLNNEEKVLIGYVCDEHLQMSSDKNILLLTQWNKNEMVINEYIQKHKLSRIFTKDVLYRIVFKLKPIDIKRCLYILFGMMQQFHLDLDNRLKNQGKNKDGNQNNYNQNEDTFVNNDTSERGCGIRNVIKKAKPNVSSESNGNEAMAVQNDPFDTLDGIDEKNHDEFVHILTVWNGLYTIEQKEQEIKMLQKKITIKRREKSIQILNDAKHKPIIQTNKKNNAKSIKPIVSQLPTINNIVWKKWINDKNKLENLYKFQGRNLWKNKTKEKLIHIIKHNYTSNWKKCFDKKSPESLQSKLYSLCGGSITN